MTVPALARKFMAATAVSPAPGKRSKVEVPDVPVEDLDFLEPEIPLALSLDR
jgi:hypothetical protein